MLSWIAAILLGALAPALLVAGLSANIMVLPIAFGITLGHAIILGLPVALYYRAKQWKRLSAAVVSAALIGAVPVGLFSWPMNYSSLKTTASVDGVVTIIDGVPTLAGWLGYLQTLGIFAGFGTLGGLAFWLTLKWSGVLTDADRDAAKHKLAPRRIGIGLAAVAVVASATVFALPSITKDRSCHNMFRDGRRSVSPSLNIDLDIALDDWPRLSKSLEEFAASNGMSFRNSSKSEPAVKVLSLSECTESGIVISVNEQRWAVRNFAPALRDRGVSISVYNPNDDDKWRSLAQDLVARLETDWTGKVRFRGRDGRIIPKPAELTSQLPERH